MMHHALDADGLAGFGERFLAFSDWQYKSFGFAFFVGGNSAGWPAYPPGGRTFGR